MPVSEGDVEAIRRLYRALLDRDGPALAKAFARAAYHVPGHNLVAGTYRGAEQILGLFARTNDLTDDGLAFELHDIVGGEEHVVMLDRVKGTRNGRTIDQARILVCHVSEGITTDVWLVVENEYDFDEFWS